MAGRVTPFTTGECVLIAVVGSLFGLLIAAVAVYSIHERARRLEELSSVQASCVDTIEERNDRAQEIVNFLLAELNAAHAAARGAPAPGPLVSSDVRPVPGGREP